MKDIIDRHDRIALQFSGGKDSLACLYVMQPYWDLLTVYWLNTGDAFPEAVAVADQIRAMVPRFVEINSDVKFVRDRYGIPSDLVPASNTLMGLVASGSGGQHIQDRYSCCVRGIMKPLHDRMKEDGITLIVRGQKNADNLKGLLRSGQVDDGIEYLFPVEDWSDRKIMSYLKEVDAPTPRFYEVMNTSPDCMGCSAYWEDGRAIYLKRYHFEEYVEYQRRLDVINNAVSQHIAHFNTEVTP